ncbi:prolyl oligopeptidase family serine peptidase [Variovorax sp. J22R24]|uniref:dienelactone hydrolase family protein n=1 Tax=Variovorax gracilis TaxID=3053502 RepID=UPI002576D8B4|nr:prolyl oligopeptidase family serine peptidase [Variovorax sp. J22R24]MDM0110011.1 prolyl oligopeptidase family serine peptidase [Variovorax sp. J22R24]
MAKTYTRQTARLILALLCVAASAELQAQHGPQTSAWSYFTPEDIHMPPKGDKVVTIVSPLPGNGDTPVPGVFFLPVGTPRGAVVIVNAPGGWTNAREGHFGRSLSSAGYIVLAIDSNGPRGAGNTLIDHTRMSFSAQLRDAYAARRHLLANGIAADRIAIMGTSRGGTIALMAADRTFLPEESERFALAIAVTPVCIFHPRTPKPTYEIFIGAGEKDEYASTQSCQDLAKAYATAGGVAKFKVYAGASNGFDGHPAMVRRIREPFAETFVDCKVVVEPDGLFAFDGRSFTDAQYIPMLQEMRKTCMGKGGSAWTNLTQKANVTLEIINFLDGSFRK